MYCVKCGVILEETEKKCPLCDTPVYHPEFDNLDAKPLYPAFKMPLNKYSRKGLGGVIIILFLIPLIISFYSDFQKDRSIEWFGYVAGGLILGYVTFALPFWFKKPNPVVFAPCSFLTLGLYLFYINIVTNGDWFFSFVLPVLGFLSLIICAIITLVYYVKKGKLYIFGGASILFGILICLLEFLLSITFEIVFIGWSIYPLIVLVLLGLLLIYLAINSNARKILERKIFF